MSTKMFRILIAITGFIGVVALSASFAINPAPPASLTIPQVVAWGKEHEVLIQAGAWLQAFGSLLEVIFILAILHITGALSRFMGLIAAASAVLIMGVSLVEVSFYLNAIAGGVSGDLATLAVSLNLIKSIQHAYVIAPAPALLLALGGVIITSHLFPRFLGYLGLAFGVALGILGFIGTFIPLQQIIDDVLTAQEVWFAILAILLALTVRKALNGSTTSEQTPVVAGNQ
nr:hypothetical protein [Ktedonobacteraceae bacterium]